MLKSEKSDAGDEGDDLVAQYGRVNNWSHEDGSPIG